MTNLTQSRNTAHKNAQNYFRKAGLQSETSIKQARKKERAESPLKLLVAHRLGKQEGE